MIEVRDDSSFRDAVASVPFVSGGFKLNLKSPANSDVLACTLFQDGRHFNIVFFYLIAEARWWPHGYCARLRIEWSGFGAWPGTLCCVLGKTLLSRCLSPPRCINGYDGGSPAMD